MIAIYFYNVLRSFRKESSWPIAKRVVNPSKRADCVMRTISWLNPVRSLIYLSERITRSKVGNVLFPNAIESARGAYIAPCTLSAFGLREMSATLLLEKLRQINNAQSMDVETWLRLEAIASATINAGKPAVIQDRSSASVAHAVPDRFKTGTWKSPRRESTVVSGKSRTALSRTGWSSIISMATSSTTGSKTWNP